MQTFFIRSAFSFGKRSRAARMLAALFLCFPFRGNIGLLDSIDSASPCFYKPKILHRPVFTDQVFRARFVQRHPLQRPCWFHSLGSGNRAWRGGWCQNRGLVQPSPQSTVLQGWPAFFGQTGSRARSRQINGRIGRKLQERHKHTYGFCSNC
jgi:hypothetical protein